MWIFLLSLSELTRAEKKTMYNCFTTSADINLFADTLQITVTLTSTKSASCDIPHGVFVSLQIDSLGSYEPSAYVQDFAYDSPQQIRLACTDPVECAKIKAAESGTVVLETKTHATFVPAGSIRVSKGLSSSCFHDNDSFVELYQGAVVLVLYPTFTCKDSIAADNLGQLKLNTLSKVKMYITYTDNSISIHDQLSISIEQDVFIPTTSVLPTSTPIRIRLSNPTISKYFEQTRINGVISKDMILFQANLEFQVPTPTPLKINAQVLMNIYKLTGFTGGYVNFNMLFLQNGYVSFRTMGAQSAAVNTYLKSLQLTSYTFEYIFTMYDVEKTEEFRMRLIDHELTSYQFNGNPSQNQQERFPGQQCDVLIQKLLKIPMTELRIQINYQFYSGDVLVTNYTKQVDKILDSCFSTGDMDYDQKTTRLKMKVNWNEKSVYCQLVKNDAVTTKIMLGNTSQVLQTQNFDFKPGQQNFEITGFNMSLQPQVRIWFYRDGTLLDAVALYDYVVHQDNALLNQEIVTVVIILATNLCFVLAYVLGYFVVVPKIRDLGIRRSKVRIFKPLADEENEV
ncbi:Conserved_hypothetical protein [Hexamita inflata]|uniref:Uncharacterized protein n=1 Tax=Hexamita inflata TaxID=28002 RepID=A0AA86RKZ0_9EUKA|nr:Conserved hypothetical protein [Hexamita inflata]